jgi:hypothetical protein
MPNDLQDVAANAGVNVMGVEIDFEFSFGISGDVMELNVGCPETEQSTLLDVCSSQVLGYRQPDFEPNCFVSYE